MARNVLVTGVSRHLGAAVARALAARPEVDTVVGLDVIPPPHDLGDARFVRADIRNPVVGSILDDGGIDTVVHMNVIATPTFAGGRSTQKEINVIGTMQLLAACQRAEGVRRLVVKSSSTVYGSSPRDPAMFTEDMTPRAMPRSGFGKDSIEVEGYVRGFARRRPDVEILMFRFANVIGPQIRTAMTDYFSLPVIPVPVGFEARLQFLHEQDAVDAMVAGSIGTTARADATTLTGALNLAGAGVMTLPQAVALTGRPWVPVPMSSAGTIGTLLRRANLADFSPDQVRFLSFGRGIDTGRAAELGITAQWSTREAFTEFVDAMQTEAGLVAPAASGRST